MGKKRRESYAGKGDNQQGSSKILISIQYRGKVEFIDRGKPKSNDYSLAEKKGKMRKADKRPQA